VNAVVKKVLHGDRRFLGKQFDPDFTQARFHENLRVLGVGGASHGGTTEQDGECQDRDDLFQHGIPPRWFIYLYDKNCVGSTVGKAAVTLCETGK
jgi:hypothetical protein